jgi:N-glycosylase/DNA lyase
MITAIPAVHQVRSGEIVSRFIPDYNLAATLDSGQTFSWSRAEDGRWCGWVGETPCVAWQEGGRFFVQGRGLTEEAAAHYFQWNLAWPETLASFPQDEWIARARAHAPGLRLLRQDPWETLAGFICSSVKQIVQIQQINAELRRRFGREAAPGWWTFPSAGGLAAAAEADLRACRLGFRARHLHRAARQIVDGEVCLEKIGLLPTEAARAELLRLAGVGEKIADCVLLFAYGRGEVFPVDVWVERILRRLYFPGRRGVAVQRLRRFARTHFGPSGGHVQQFLFHWIRTAPEAETLRKTERKAKKPARSGR